MHRSLRSLLLSSALAGSLLAAPLLASQGGQGATGKAGQAKADPPAQAEGPAKPQAAADGAAAPQKPTTSNTPPPTESRADLRTFGGTCIGHPVGDYPQVGGLLAAFVPQLVGAGVDALTAALEAAGQDRTRSQSTVVALEDAVSCVQVARGVTALSGYNSPTLQNAVEGAPFLVEFLFRQSTDGSALLVTPTLLTYRETLDRRRTSRPRTLYVTLTFRDTSGEHISPVTVPLGAYATRQDRYTLDPVGAPLHPDGISSLGAANSIWIPNPFRRVGSQKLEVPGQSGQPAATPDAAEGFGPATPHGTQVTPTAPAHPQDQAAGQSPPPPPALAVGRGTAIMPVSITVAITEVRPGSSLARFLAGVLRGSRGAVVTALDPAQREAARQTAQTADTQRRTTLRTAEAAYDDAFRAYCAAPRAERITKVSAFRTAQLNLLDALQALNEPRPSDFPDPINGRTGQNQVADDKMCADYPGYVAGS